MNIEIDAKLFDALNTFAIDVYYTSNARFHCVSNNRIKFSFDDEMNETHEYFVNYESIMHYIEIYEFVKRSFERNRKIKQIDLMMHDESYSTRKMSYAHFEIVNENDETYFAIVHANISKNVTMRCTIYTHHEYEMYVNS